MKLLLVEDYIELNKISISCEKENLKLSNLEEKEKLVQIIELKNNLFEVYEKIFFRFGLMDVSYLLLKESLNSKQCEFKVVNVLQLDEVLFRLKMMVQTLTLKLKKLSLNEIELKYVVQKLPV